MTRTCRRGWTTCARPDGVVAGDGVKGWGCYALLQQAVGVVIAPRTRCAAETRGFPVVRTYVHVSSQCDASSVVMCDFSEALSSSPSPASRDNHRLLALSSPHASYCPTTYAPPRLACSSRTRRRVRCREAITGARAFSSSHSDGGYQHPLHVPPGICSVQGSFGEERNRRCCSWVKWQHVHRSTHSDRGMDAVLPAPTPNILAFAAHAAAGIA